MTNPVRYIVNSLRDFYNAQFIGTSLPEPPDALSAEFYRRQREMSGELDKARHGCYSDGSTSK